MKSAANHSAVIAGPVSPARFTRLRFALSGTLLLLSAALFALHFVHLAADFPNNSRWVDWSKYTDEGWYGDAAIRHFLFGHWYLPGDFNPAVALPVWPLLEAAVFRFTGVSVIAARALTVVVFGLMLVAVYALIQRFDPSRFGPGIPTPSPGIPLRNASQPSNNAPVYPLAAPLSVLLFCASPFFFVFDRLAILEPLLAALTVLALLVASFLQPWRGHGRTGRDILRSLSLGIALGLLLPAMVLTKTTAVTVLPAIGYVIWKRAGSSPRRAVALALPPALLGLGLWLGYFFLLVRPHFLVDYRYLFSANAYTGFQLEPLARVLFNTVADGRWMGGVLYALFFAAMAVLVFRRPSFFRNPLVGALLLWVAGYFAFLAYHNNLQPRYYLMLAVPVTMLFAMACEELLCSPAAGISTWRAAVATAAILAMLVPNFLYEIEIVRHPEYTLEAAAHAIARIVRSNPSHAQRILSISGSEITLMTGLPSIDDDFGTLDLDKRVEQYRPGWYVAWNDIEDDKMDALTPLYHPVRVAAFPAMDDPERNLLILYRLDPGPVAGPPHRGRRRTPRPLRTRLGQQPSTTQLQH